MAGPHSRWGIAPTGMGPYDARFYGAFAASSCPDRQTAPIYEPRSRCAWLHETSLNPNSHSIWRFLLGIGLLLASLGVLAGDRLLERGYLEDPGGRLSWEQVAQAPFQPFTEILTLGYRPSVYWLKLRLDPGTPGPSGNLVLRLRPNYLDKVTLYDPDFGQLGDTVTGDLYPGTIEPYRSLNLNFLLSRGTQPRNLWLRIDTTSTLLAEVGIHSMAETLALDKTQEARMVAIITLLAALTGWGAFQTWVGRDPLFALFTLKNGFASLGLYSLSGAYRLYADTAQTLVSANLFSDLCLPPMVASGILFDYFLIKRQQPNTWLLWGLLVLSGLPLVYYGLYAMGQRHLPFTLLQWITLIWPLVSVLLDVTIPQQQSRPKHQRSYLTRNHLLLYHGMMVALIVFSFFPQMGFIHANDWVFNGYLFYYLLSAVTMLALLQFRLARQNQRRLERRTALIEAEAHREEQARWLALLNHELRTPLSTLNLVLSLPGQDNELQQDCRDAVRRISQLLERCQLADQLEAGRLTLRPEVVDLSDLLSGLMARSPAPQRLQLTGPPPGAITTDRQLLEIILGNLLDNAVKYAAPGTPIEIRIRPDSLGAARGIEISVHNLPGPVGWPDPSQLFRKYHRAPAAAGQPGSGLGLYLAQQLTRRLHGRLDYCPTASHIRFCLWLPRQDWS